MFGRLLKSNKFNSGGKYRKLVGTTTAAYRMVINCTTAESVLELVSKFKLACSSHCQETEEIIENVGLFIGASEASLIYTKQKLKNTFF